MNTNYEKLPILKLATNVPVEATMIDDTHFWTGEGRYGIQFAFKVEVQGKPHVFYVGENSRALQDFKMFSKGDEVTIIKQEWEDGKKTISVKAKGDISVQPQNLGIPSGKEHSKQLTNQRNMQEENDERQAKIIKQACIKAACSLHAGGKAEDAIKSAKMFENYVNGIDVDLPF